MRIAVVSDIHANWTALEAVVADIRSTSPDLVLHGGDLADGGASPVAVVDRIRELGWAGILGNTDEMLVRPESLREIADRNPGSSHVFRAVEDMASYTRERLGEDRLSWLRTLPRVYTSDVLALVHGTPATPWVAPSPDATDAELDTLYGPLASPIAIYGHIHRPFVRELPGFVVANAGSVGLPYDGDSRASYLLVDDGRVEIRRVEYAVDAEVRCLACSGLPHAEWVSRLITGATYRPL